MHTQSELVCYIGTGVVDYRTCIIQQHHQYIPQGAHVVTQLSWLQFVKMMSALPSDTRYESVQLPTQS